ncbi:hypothetical protein BC940DRAFT_288708 [Gongronella butleri]|nr:hypothetical protein BC940DRAFT_288708 [Gongronella butleri]
MSGTVMDMQLFFASLHDKTSFNYNNLDQLSSLWAAFTKCKRNLRDGFRLENMSWRLWYRETRLRRPSGLPSTMTLPHNDTTHAHHDTPSSMMMTSKHDQSLGRRASTDQEPRRPRLMRTRSLPSLSYQNAQILDAVQPEAAAACAAAVATSAEAPAVAAAAATMPDSASTSPSRSKFFIDMDESDDGSDIDSLYDEDDDYFQEDGCYTSSSSSDSSVMDGDFDALPAAKQQQPISLLTALLQKQAAAAAAADAAAADAANIMDGTASPLRRCHCRHDRLDQWFLQQHQAAM